MRTRKDIEALESKVLAPYAMKSQDAGARQYDEAQHELRTCYQRDRDRIVHSEAFRKLEYKTQVFVIFEGDYYRTRLTHTIEVAQLARTLGRNLRLNEDLIEAIALAHDLGHPPFGHAGEEALNSIVREAKIRFNHNFRSYEIVAKLEKKYPHFDGLNLTREVLVGILKHQTVFDMPGADIPKQYRDEGPTLEAQIVDIADSLAYLNHDVDDGLTSGCIVEEDLMDSVLWQKAVRKFGGHRDVHDQDMFRYQAVGILIDMQVKDLLKATYERLVSLKFRSAQAVKDHKGYVVGFSKVMHQEREFLQQLLNEKLYHHWRVERMTAKARRIIRDLFDVYLRKPKQLPYSIYARDKKFTTSQKYAIICNYIASMTDRFALDEHKRLIRSVSEGLKTMTHNPILLPNAIIWLSAVHMVYRLVNSTYTVKELTLRLTRLLCQFIRASSASVYLVHPVKKNVVICASFDNQINIWRDKPSELKDVGEDVLAVTRGASVLKDDCIGLPLVADDYLGAIFVRRGDSREPFSDFDYEMLSVFSEQVVTAMKNLQLNQEHEKIILGQIASIGNLLKKQSYSGLTHAPVYMEIVKMLADFLKVNNDGIKQLEYASLLHDIGIIDVPYAILSKRGGLSANEFKVVRQHTAHSVALISPVEFLKPVLPIILYHHEKYDGSGYPSGLKKEQIPLGARIIACVDAFEAMVQGRPYRSSLSIDAALDELVKYRGSQFDPKIVDAFVKLASQKKFRKLLSLLKA